MANCECKTFMMKNSWVDKPYTCMLEVAEYAEGKAPAIQVLCWSDDYGGGWEPYAMATVNIPNKKLRPGCVYLDTNNAPEVAGAFEMLDLVVPTGYMAFSGFCMYPEVMLNWPRIQKFSETNLMEKIASFDSVSYEHFKEIMSDGEEE